MLIDSHCHLDAPEFDHDREAVARACGAAGVQGLLIPAVAPFNFEAVRSLAHTVDGARYALGIHPMYVMPLDLDEALASLETAVRAALIDPRFVAIGEIGLDFFVPGLDADKQTAFYLAQLKLARRFDLPVILHVRRSQDQLLKGLRQHHVPGGIAHAFNGSEDQTRHFLDRGFRLGFGGAATYPGSQRIRRLAGSLPLDAMVLETDSPDIPPQWLDDGQGHRGRNSPAELPRICETIAALRGVPPAEFGAACARNTLAALPRWQLQATA
ncbi:MAG TPA: TatD family hydrolase [Burkholderiaceae bacterium]|nr:TatD family hydrolase [Burkholderiaceae bacterium]